MNDRLNALEARIKALEDKLAEPEPKKEKAPVTVEKGKTAKSGR